MVKHAQRELPREAVGLVGGRDSSRAVAVLPLVNRVARHAFFADPYAQYLAEKWLSANGLSAIAVYHSHPFGGTSLSATDLHFARNSQLVQIVIAVADRRTVAELKAYRIVDGIPIRVDIAAPDLR
jgi:proteasome lid subunit RPN8/RPN11